MRTAPRVLKKDPNRERDRAITVLFLGPLKAQPVSPESSLAVVPLLPRKVASYISTVYNIL